MSLSQPLPPPLSALPKTQRREETCTQLCKQFQAELGQNPALPGGTLRILSNHLFLPASKNTQNWHGQATGNILFPDVHGDQQKGIVSLKPAFFFFFLLCLSRPLALAPPPLRPFPSLPPVLPGKTQNHQNEFKETAPQLVSFKGKKRGVQLQGELPDWCALTLADREYQLGRGGLLVTGEPMRRDSEPSHT